LSNSQESISFRWCCCLLGPLCLRTGCPRTAADCRASRGTPVPSRWNSWHIPPRGGSAPGATRAQPARSCSWTWTRTGASPFCPPAAGRLCRPWICTRFWPPARSHRCHGPCSNRSGRRNALWCRVSAKLRRRMQFNQIYIRFLTLTSPSFAWYLMKLRRAFVSTKGN